MIIPSNGVIHSSFRLIISALISPTHTDFLFYRQSLWPFGFPATQWVGEVFYPPRHIVQPHRTLSIGEYRALAYEWRKLRVPCFPPFGRYIYRYALFSGFLYHSPRSCSSIMANFPITETLGLPSLFNAVHSFCVFVLLSIF